MIAAYEIGYYTGDKHEWISHEIISADTEAKYPGTVARRLTYTQGWERSFADAKKGNWVGWENWTHVPGSTIVRELIPNEPTK